MAEELFVTLLGLRFEERETQRPDKSTFQATMQRYATATFHLSDHKAENGESNIIVSFDVSTDETLVKDAWAELHDFSQRLGRAVEEAMRRL